MADIMEFKKLIPNPQFNGVSDVEAQEVQDLQSKVKIIDVRRNDEYTGELGHIKGAELIVLDTVPENVNKIPKDKTVVLVCRSGGRSGQAAAFLQSQGFNNVVNMRGGMLQWNELKLPVER